MESTQSPDNTEDIPPIDFVSLDEFRSNPANGIALRGFLDSKEGQMFLAVLHGLSPSRALASPRHMTPDAIRAAASATQAASPALLGMISGYELVHEAIRRMARPVRPAAPKPRTATPPHPSAH